jgi:hypothetical protein
MLKVISNLFKSETKDDNHNPINHIPIGICDVGHCYHKVEDPILHSKLYYLSSIKGSHFTFLIFNRKEGTVEIETISRKTTDFHQINFIPSIKGIYDIHIQIKED